MEFKPLKSLETYLDALIKGKLWVKVIVALALGVVAGILLSPGIGLFSAPVTESIGSWLALPGKIFFKLVQMIMIPLIFASIITGLVSNTGEQLKKMGMSTVIYFLLTTLISVAIGIVLSLTIQPGNYFELQESNTIPLTTNNNTQDKPLFENLPDTISELIPGNPLASMLSGEMLAIVIFTIIIGIAITQLKDQQKEPVVGLLSSIQEICMTVVKWAMRLVPYAVFGLIAQLVSTIGISSLKGIGMYIITVLVGLILLLFFYLIIIRLLGRQNPWQFMRSVRDVQLLAFSTTSSAAVMPLSIQTAQNKLNVSKSVSNFLIPVGATINMDGTAIYQCISTLFIAQAYGLEIGISSILMVMFTIIAASVGTPAIPGGGVIILATILQGMGIPGDGIVLIIGVERILGMFRTAINVTGDLTACVVFNRLQEKWAG